MGDEETGYSDTTEEVQDWQNLDGSGTNTVGDYTTSDYDWTQFDAATENYLKENYPELAQDASLFDQIGAAFRKLGTSAFNNLKTAFTDPKTGGVNWKNVAGAAGGLYGLYQSQQKPEKTGYQGGIPKYEAVREKVANTYDPDRRPGSSAQEYFTKTRFAAPADAAAARTTAKEEAVGLEAVNKANPARQTRPVLQAGAEKKEAEKSEVKAASSVIKDLPVPKYASGGIAEMAKGRYLGGATDGMADKIPARIGGKQEAKLSHGEFVIPADVVGHLGNGNSEAGAKRLYEMMDRIRQARTGTTKQGKQVNPDKFLPT
jgi:hypothetical protein